MAFLDKERVRREPRAVCRADWEVIGQDSGVGIGGEGPTNTFGARGMAGRDLLKPLAGRCAEVGGCRPTAVVATPPALRAGLACR